MNDVSKIIYRYIYNSKDHTCTKIDIFMNTGYSCSAIESALSDLSSVSVITYDEETGNYSTVYKGKSEEEKMHDSLYTEPTASNSSVTLEYVNVTPTRPNNYGQYTCFTNMVSDNTLFDGFFD